MAGQDRLCTEGPLGGEVVPALVRLWGGRVREQPVEHAGAKDGKLANGCLRHVSSRPRR